MNLNICIELFEYLIFIVSCSVIGEQDFVPEHVQDEGFRDRGGGAHAVWGHAVALQPHVSVCTILLMMTTQSFITETYFFHS